MREQPNIRVSVGGDWEKKKKKEDFCGVNRQSVALWQQRCRQRWLANLTVHPHAKRCTYHLRNGALHESAFTLESVCNDTCTISDPVVGCGRGVSVRLYLPEVFLSLSRFSPLFCCRYTPVRTYYSFSGLFMHHHPQR